MGTPEGSNGIACKVDVDGRAHDGDEDDGVEPSQVPSDERNTAGDQQRVRNKSLGPEGGCYALWRIEDQDSWKAGVNRPHTTSTETAVTYRDKIR